MRELIEILENRGYAYTQHADRIIVVEKGAVDLDSLTTLPEGVKFENQGHVFLRNLTTLPEGVKFENQGNVYLSSLTTLPEGMKFENQGAVFLDSLTTLPEGVNFDNQGHVYLSSLTTLPEGMKFENQGAVFLDSLTTLPEGMKFDNQGHVDLSSLSGKCKYLGVEIEIQNIDGYTMLIESRKERDGIQIIKARYFGGGELTSLKKCYIAQKGEYSAHGETIKAAINDVVFKHMQDNLDVSKLVAEIKKRGTVTRNDYRLLTGACRAGIAHFLESKGLADVESLPLEEVLRITKGAFGGERLSELFAH